jgi:hypothetical protein
MKLYTALVELLEAKAELLREEAATLQLGKYAEGYRDGQKDIFEGSEVVYVSGDDEDEDD